MTTPTIDSLPYMRGQLGDLLALESPSLADRHRIRLEMNRLQQQVSNLSVLMDNTGNLDPNLFMKHSRGFSIMPNECASLRFSTQAIGTGSWTVPTTNAAVAATFGHGIEIDTTNSLMKVVGLPGESVYLFCCWWQWEQHTTGYRALAWWTDDGGGVTDLRDAEDGSYQIYNHLTHMRKQVSTDASYQMKVYHSRGDDLDGDGLFTAMRIR